MQFRSNLLIDVQFIEDIDQMCMWVYEIDTANKSSRDNNTQFYITTSGDEKNQILLKNYHICYFKRWNSVSYFYIMINHAECFILFLCEVEAVAT